MLKAFLDLVILQTLEQRSMTAYRIDNLIGDRFHAKISANVIYTKLATMEARCLVKCKLHDGKTYSITEKGKELLCNKPMIIKEINSSTITIFES